MKLHVLYTSDAPVIADMINVGVTSKPKKRVVSINLTAAQEILIKPKCLGLSVGKEVFEDIQEIWLDLD